MIHVKLFPILLHIFELSSEKRAENVPILELSLRKLRSSGDLKMTLTKLDERDRYRRTSATDNNLIALTPIDNQDKKQSIEEFRKNFSMMASGEGLDFKDLDQIEKTGLKKGLVKIVH